MTSWLMMVETSVGFFDDRCDFMCSAGRFRMVYAVHGAFAYIVE